MTDLDRALVPVVGKGLEVLLVLLYVASLVTVLHGGVLPEYRTAAGAEVSDRTLVTAADRIEASVPPPSTAVDVTRTVDLPDTIDRATYRLRAVNGTLVLDHPDDALSGRVPLALPDRVVAVRGTWESDDPAVVRVRGDAEGVRVILE
ncbi:DUF7266 family protein [Haloplanus aerogenes]|uniref:Uncharacterized protein n=1 Tax=Haloplanus aerogenes TaxID=660522 RepID=A0A3M0DSU3_9EURY|nr:hypothetical protein [Haloplanus aerogenes]AZH24528.1 hypothetical protein DU502_03635 [Haloplanus aerogenes]RMB23820.1 hypothetical protein ATH50_1050 [Haloplanus aerogenes]